MTANKYGAKSSKCLRRPPHNHDSALGASVCNLYLAKEQHGECRLKQTEKTLYLGKARYQYRVDFWLEDLKTGEDFYGEAKGPPLLRRGRWPTTRKQWKAHGLGRLEVYSGKWQSPFLVETIYPEKESA